MPRYARNFYTLIEFGTDKICVLVGTKDAAGNPEVLSFAQKNSANSICKGEILDCNAALRILAETMDDAMKSLRGVPERGGSVYYLVNGPSVSSLQGEGSVMIYDAAHKVTNAHVDDAIERARSMAHSPEQVNFNIFDSYFVIDGTTRVRNPVGQLAERLDASVHIVSTEKKRIDAVNAMLRELGWEQGGEPVFTGIAAVYGNLTSDEREHGTLILDFGAGSCSYAAVVGEGVLLSGVLPAGMNNVANDLSIGLDLPYEFCLDFLRKNRLSVLRADGVNFLEYSAAAGKTRRIPLDSFEKIIDLRLREMFTLIRDRVSEKQLFPLLEMGAVLTGGGSLIDSAPDTLRDVMSLHVRRGEPSDFAGAKTSFQSAPCCYSALSGLLRYAVAMDSENSNAGLSGIGDALAGMFDGFISRWKKTTKALKI